MRDELSLAQRELQSQVAGCRRMEAALAAGASEAQAQRTMFEAQVAALRQELKVGGARGQGEFSRVTKAGVAWGGLGHVSAAGVGGGPPSCD